MKRNRITIIVEVDTDSVPGWGNDPNDYVKHIEHQLSQTIPHYNPTVRLLGENEYIGGPSDEKFSVKAKAH